LDATKIFPASSIASNGTGTLARPKNAMRNATIATLTHQPSHLWRRLWRGVGRKASDAFRKASKAASNWSGSKVYGVRAMATAERIVLQAQNRVGRILGQRRAAHCAPQLLLNVSLIITPRSARCGTRDGARQESAWPRLDAPRARESSEISGDLQ